MRCGSRRDRLRYTLEFVRQPLEPRATVLLRPVVALQDRLGDLRDLAATAAHADAFAGSGDAGKGRPVVERFARYARRRAARLALRDAAGVVDGCGPAVSRGARPGARHRRRARLNVDVARP